MWGRDCAVHIRHHAPTPYNASNLGKVAELYRARHPERAIYIAGDSDRKKVPNVGRIKAEEAAAAIGGKALFPAFPDGVKGTDWNDLVKAIGRKTAQISIQCAVRVADRQTEAAKSAAPAIEQTPRQQAARETAELER